MVAQIGARVRAPAAARGGSMAPMDRTRLAREIHRASHLTGRFVLRSGAVSDEYFDKYLFESDPRLLSAIGDALVPLVPSDADALAGLETGGIPLAVILAQKTGRPARFVRKEAKTYGTAKLAEGGEVDGLRLLVVEDVVTSGGQLLASVRDLRERGAIVDAALCVIDRQAGGPEALAAEGIELRALFTMAELAAASVD